MSVQYENRESDDQLPEGGEDQQPTLTPEEYLEERKRTIRRRSWWVIGIGVFLVVSHLFLFFLFIHTDFFAAIFNQVSKGDMLTWSHLFQSITFLIGLFLVAGGIWGLREARRMTLDDLIPSPEAVEFIRQAENVTPYYSYILVACIVAVFVFQMAAGGTDDKGNYDALAVAGLVKADFWTKGEYWRILTSGALHGGILHIYFNSQALYGFGSLIEFLSNRAHLAIVFLLSVIGGGIFSAVFMPTGVSVGASGGIIGLLGYLAIYGYRRKRQVPPDFLRTLLVNIGFIAAFGLVAYQIIDNFGHLGGFLTGALYGFVQIPKDLHADPRRTSAFAEGLGLISLGVFVFVSVLTILLILEIIKF